ncbi:hypothetical protein D9758_015480 [Tetrapyrgos nigripes]|uniref:Uncharacterized protein n=1 Tax=Tetrapyrgos nigripes TaxID=182062 RepID=A0A8H5CNB6_9AGAR|nr:hypothetical protein D9758_015480 [Tetrapyrgos nigripes]
MSSSTLAEEQYQVKKTEKQRGVDEEQARLAAELDASEDARLIKEYFESAGMQVPGGLQDLLYSDDAEESIAKKIALERDGKEDSIIVLIEFHGQTVQYIRLKPGAWLVVTTSSMDKPEPVPRNSASHKAVPLPLWDSDDDPSPHKPVTLPLWDSDEEPEIGKDECRDKKTPALRSQAPLCGSDPPKKKDGQNTSIAMYRAWCKVPSVFDLVSSWPNDEENIPVFVVTQGWHVGIFVSWKTTQHFVSYVFGPMYKKCPSLAIAIKWWSKCLNNEKLHPKVLERLVTAPPYPIMCQTAAWAGDSLIVESGQGGDVFSDSGLPIHFPALAPAALAPATSSRSSGPPSAPVTPRSTRTLIHIHDSDSETNDEYSQHFNDEFGISELRHLSSQNM